MRRSLLIILFIFLHIIVYGQTGNLSGKVFDDNNHVVPGATVSIKSLNRVVATDENGAYHIDNLKFGTYKLMISSVVTAVQSFDVKVSSAQMIFNAKVKATKDKELNQVTVQGATEKRKIETTGFAVNVIDTREASLRNLQTNELLDRTVGVRVRQNGGLGSEVEYNLNGMTGRSVGIFIDGIDISTYGSSFNLNNIPPAMIERIEVYKGVLPSHLSGDLLGGAINIVMKKGTGNNNIVLSTSYGSFNTTQSDVSGMYRNAKNGLTARASGFYSYSDNDYEIWGRFSKNVEPNGVVTRNHRARRFNDAYRALGGRFELGFTDVKWADAFFLGYNGSDSHKEIQHGQTMGTPYKGRFADAKANVFNLTYNKRDLLTKGLNLQFNGVYSERNTYLQDTVSWLYNWDGQIRRDLNGNLMRTRDGAQQGIPTITSIDRQITNLRTNLSYDIFAGHRLSLNHVYYDIDRQDENLLVFVGDNAVKGSNDLSKNVFSLNYEAQWLNNRLTTNIFGKSYQQKIGRVSPIVTVVNGQNVVNMETISDSRTATGYGLAVSYALTPKVILISSTERAVRMAADNEIFGSPDENIQANPTLRPEISDNFNAGFKLGTFDFSGHRLSLSGNAFWRNIKDRIMRRANTLLNDQEIEVSPFVNLGKAQSRGFEGELSYNYKKLNVLFNFSKFNSLYKIQFDPATGQQLDYYNKQIPNEPFFTMNGNVQYRMDNLIQKKSMVNLYYTIGYVAPFRTIWPESEWYTTPAQYAQNVGFSYGFPNRKFLVSFDAKNILNAEIYDNFGVQKPGRAFYLKLNYTINKF
ncbi:TonB-dependent receptor [Pedobacter sp. MC2016-15]|uniref:TonB-dependent receptor n=1 Tax=Pedobacter sp. MC2016-15 TaxID=2994473 RepID=UPI002245E0F1|nr:TonB-dependent receptor [Pedobacter sp. MC2016-15]MCX2480299.1 TonB-dependent receptor [Pedobacter sp. MC2016-15]